MASAFTFQLSGVAELQQRLTLLTDDLKSEVKAEIGFAAEELAGLAKTDAPADQGFLRNAISTFGSETSQGVQYDVVVQNEIAAFQEFGTGAKFHAEPGFEAYAAQFKGQKGGGTFKDMIAAIVAWVRRKGIAGTYSSGVKKAKGGGFAIAGTSGKRRGNKINQLAEDYAVAYAIAVSILHNGLTPHPYLFHNFMIVEKKLIQRVKTILFEITK